MSENKKKKAADNLPAASGQPDAQAGEKESLFKDGEQIIGNNPKYRRPPREGAD